METNPTQNKEELQPEESKNPPKSQRMLIYIGLLTALTVILAAGSYLYSQYSKKFVKPDPNSTSPSTQKQEESTETDVAIPTAEEFTEAQIAYIKECGSRNNGNVWILDTVSKTQKQITTNCKNSNPKWSPDGKKLAWIESKQIDTGYWDRDLQMNIKIMDYLTQETEYLLDEYKLNNLQSEKSGEEAEKRELLQVQDFDWSPNSRKIVYSRNGVWTKNVETKKAELLLEPCLDKSSIMEKDLPKDFWELSETSFFLYNSVYHSPDGKKLLLKVKRNFMGASSYEVLNINTKKLLTIINKTGLKPNCIEWSPDSGKILYSGECGGWLGGTHYYDLETKETKTVHQSGTLSSYWLNNTNFITVTSNIKNECFPSEEGFKLAILNLEGATLKTIIPKVDMSRHRVFKKGVSADKEWVLIGTHEEVKEAVSINNGRTVEFKLEASDLNWRP